jgi:large subunit ribosomal protein L6
MSKIGKLPIALKNGINVTITDNLVHVTGIKGEMSYTLPKGIKISQEETQLVVAREKDSKELRAMWGLARAQVANMVTGVDLGFEKKLELQGVGYRAQVQGNELVLSLGFSHPVKFSPKEGIKISVADNIITIAGINKMLVGELAANIRAVKAPEPYKGKGIRYVGEIVRRKAGKAAKAVGAK